MDTNTDAYMERIRQDEFNAGWSNWKVTGDSGIGLPRYVEAEAQTGSRYVVVATSLPAEGRLREGGPILVTVLWPWQDAWCMAAGGMVVPSYIAEHLTAGRDRRGALHMGDLAALTRTVAQALGREAGHPWRAE